MNETKLDALLREIREELGLNLSSAVELEKFIVCISISLVGSSTFANAVAGFVVVTHISTAVTYKSCIPIGEISTPCSWNVSSDIGKLIIEQLEKNLSESSFRATATG